MILRKRIEDNVAIWLLGSLLTGFLSGVATYQAILDIAGLEPVAEARLDEAARLPGELSEAKERLSEAKATSAEAIEEASRLRQEITELRAQLTTSGVSLEKIRTASAARDEAMSNPNALIGSTVHVEYFEGRAQDAAWMRKRLEANGAKVKLTVVSECYSAWVPNVLYYQDAKHLDAAIMVQSLIAEKGVHKYRSKHGIRWADEEIDICIK